MHRQCYQAELRMCWQFTWEGVDRTTSSIEEGKGETVYPTREKWGRWGVGGWGEGVGG